MVHISSPSLQLVRFHLSLLYTATNEGAGKHDHHVYMRLHLVSILIFRSRLHPYLFSNNFIGQINEETDAIGLSVFGIDSIGYCSKGTLSTAIGLRRKSLIFDYF